MSFFRALISRPIFLGIICFVLLGSSHAADGTSRARRPTPGAGLKQQFKLKVGQRVSLKGTRLQIQFIGVDNDSRCPQDVTCVWAGNAAVRVQLSVGRRTETLTLNTSNNPSFEGESSFEGYKIKLVDLNPYPHSERRIAAGDYTATLLVSKE